MKTVCALLFVAVLLFGAWELLIYAVNNAVCHKDGKTITCSLPDVFNFNP
jgi:hypothetical protein